MQGIFVFINRTHSRLAHDWHACSGWGHSRQRKTLRRRQALQPTRLQPHNVQEAVPSGRNAQHGPCTHGALNAAVQTRATAETRHATKQCLPQQHGDTYAHVGGCTGWTRKCGKPLSTTHGEANTATLTLRASGCAEPPLRRSRPESHKRG